MRKYIIGIVVLDILVIIVVVLGFIAGGTPISQRAIALDTARLSDFSNIKYDIENYYQVNKKLPGALADLKILAVKDPETKQSYTYSAVSSTSYKLCTDFSADSSKQNQNYPSSINDSNETNHKKGYDCIQYILPDYIVSPSKSGVYVYPSPTPEPSDYPFLQSCKLDLDNSSTSPIKIMGIYETKDSVVFTTNMFANAVVNTKRNYPNLPQSGGASNYYYGQNLFKQEISPDKSGVNTTEYMIKVTDKSGNNATSQQYTFQGERTVLSDPRCNGKDIVSQ